ncbi:MAG: ATP synthase F1 subunit epsilon [Lentisphaerae bacterium]|nr:ATP synthase F1 subunit epsilon [Lentisphaerota bacterium]
MALFHLEIATPEQRIVAADVLAVTLPVAEGEIQILAGHIPLLTRLTGGAVEITMPDGTQEFLALGEGFARITPTHVAVLSEDAVHARDVDEIEVEEARRKAEARLNEKLSAEEHAAVSATLAHAAAQLRIKRRQQGGR